MSCEEDVFDKKPIDKISEANVWGNEDVIRTYLTDLYSRLPGMDGHDHQVGWDRYDPYLSDPHNATTLTLGNMTRNNEDLSFWNYSLIRDINLAIEKIRTSDEISVVIRDQMMGQVFPIGVTIIVNHRVYLGRRDHAIILPLIIF